MDTTIRNRWAQAFEQVGLSQQDYTRILNEIMDILAKETSSITILFSGGDNEGTKSEVATALGIKEEQVDDLFAGKFATVKIEGDNTDNLCNRLATGTVDGGSFWAKYGAQGILVGITAEFYFDAADGGKYFWSMQET